MSANVDQVKATIRHLLRLSENNAATEGEVANAIRFARRLMDAHHLQEDDVRNDPHEAAADRETMDRRTVYSATRSLAFWESTLCDFIEDLVGTVQFFMQKRVLVKRGGRIVFSEQGDPLIRQGINFYGPAEDVALACDLFDTFHQTIATAARLKYGGALRGAGRNYCEGFVYGMGEKLDAARKQDAAANEQSRALIVRSTAIARATQQRASTWLTAQGIELKSRDRSRRGDFTPSAFEDGTFDGSRTPVDAKRKSKITGSTQRRLTQ